MTTIAYIAVSAFVLWVFYLAYAALYASWEKLSLATKVLGSVVVFIGAVVDVTFNWTVGLLLGITRDVTFSQKISRLKKVGGWRASVSIWICANLLDPFQLGGHCS